MNEMNKMNKMNEIIRKRKSVRKYDFTPLDDATFEKITAKIAEVTPLYPDINFDIRVINKTKGLLNNVKAPHYLAFGSEEKDGALENIGFIGQQMDLFFSGSGIGACWLGGAKPEEESSHFLPFVICMAFGRPAEPLHRDISEFRRKPLTEISEGNDKRLEAARLAPSATNSQNWYFVATDEKIHCYRKLSNKIIGAIYNKLHCIDIGIALCHMAEESKNFNFAKEAGVPERSGYIYMGTVS